jgi:hypothetical protein
MGILGLVLDYIPTIVITTLHLVKIRWKPRVLVVRPRQNYRGEIPRVIVRIRIFIRPKNLMHIDCKPRSLQKAITAEMNLTELRNDLFNQEEFPD